jgi:hypothetical protein
MVKGGCLGVVDDAVLLVELLVGNVGPVLYNIVVVGVAVH